MVPEMTIRPMTTATKRARQRVNHVRVRLARVNDHEDDEEEKERHIGNRRDALAPEMIGSFLGRAKAANLTQRVRISMRTTFRSE